MSEAIYEWMKNLAIFYIFLTVVMNLVPNSQYGEYLKFFMGLILILMVLSPLLQILQLKDAVGELFRQNTLEQSYLEAQIGDFQVQMNENAGGSFDGRLSGEERASDTAANEIQSRYLHEGYQREIEQNIETRLTQLGYEVKSVQVKLGDLSGDGVAGKLQVQQIDVWFAGLTEGSEEVIRSELGGTYETAPENIRIFSEELQ